MTVAPDGALYVALRVAHYLGVFGVVGVVALRRAGGLPGGAGEGRAWRVGLAAALLLLAAAAARLPMQAMTLLDEGQRLDGAMLAATMRTRWATAWLAQAGVAGAVVAALLLARAAPRLGWGLALPVVIAAAVVTPLTGHAVTPAAIPVVGLAVQAAHVLGGALWLGALAALAAAHLGPAPDEAARAAQLKHAVARFSPLALAGAALVAGSGAALGWRYVGTLDALVTTDYGRALLLKLAGVGGIVLLGAYHSRRLPARLGTPPATAAFRRSAGAELTLALVVLVVTAVLVAEALPGEVEMEE